MCDEWWANKKRNNLNDIDVFVEMYTEVCVTESAYMYSVLCMWKTEEESRRGFKDNKKSHEVFKFTLQMMWFAVWIFTHTIF